MQSKLTRNFYLPTDEEDVAINNGIAADPDTYELSDAEFSLLTFRELDNPFSEQTKESVTIRLSSDVISAFRATGTASQVG